MSKCIDITGMTFGKLTVRSRAENNKNGKAMWECECDCGNAIIVEGGSLRSGKTKSCGCLRNETPSNYVDLTGDVFGRLTVVGRVGSDKNGRPTWECQCECGNLVILDTNVLRSGKTRSCGCLKRDTMTEKNTTHGMSKTRLYHEWYKIKERTTRKTDKSYPRYGGAGIGICDEWANDFVAFAEWSMSNGYNDGLSIDRIDNGKGYSPDNCRWATAKQQANNKTNNVTVTINGETKTVAEWSDVFGINSNTVYHRRYNGWDDEYLFIPSSSEKYKKRKRNEPQGSFLMGA